MQRNGSFIGRFFTWLLCVLASIVVFFLIGFWVLFNCMYTEGSERLAAELMQLKATSFIPDIYFSQEEVGRIRNTYVLVNDQSSAVKVVDAGQKTEDDKPEQVQLELKDVSATPAPASGRRGESVQYAEGIAIVQHPTPSPVPEKTAAPTLRPVPTQETVVAQNVPMGVLSNPAEFKMMGKLVSRTGAKIVLRGRPTFDTAQTGSAPAGTWVTVLETKGQFPKIMLDGVEYYVYRDMLEIISMPVLTVKAPAEDAPASAPIDAY